MYLDLNLDYTTVQPWVGYLTNVSLNFLLSALGNGLKVCCKPLILTCLFLSNA